MSLDIDERRKTAFSFIKEITGQDAVETETSEAQKAKLFFPDGDLSTDGKRYIQEADKLLGREVFVPESVFTNAPQELRYGEESVRVSQDEQKSEPVFYEPKESESYTHIKEMSQTGSHKHAARQNNIASFLSELGSYGGSAGKTDSAKPAMTFSDDIAIDDIFAKANSKNSQNRAKENKSESVRVYSPKAFKSACATVNSDDNNKLPSAAETKVKENTSAIKDSAYPPAPVGTSPGFPAIRENGSTRVFDTKNAENADNTASSSAGTTSNKPFSQSKSFDVMEGQMVLNGFENEEKTDTVSEEDVVRSLEEKRRKNAKNFRLMEIANAVGESAEPEVNPMEYHEFKGDGREEESKYKTIERVTLQEYTSRSHRIQMSQLFKNKKGRALLKIFTLSLINIVSFIFLLVINFHEGASTGGGYAFGSMTLLILAAAVSFNSVSEGFRSLLNFKPDFNTSVALSVIGVFIQSFIVTVLNKQDNTALLVCAGVSVLLMSAICEFFEFSRTEANFKFIAFDFADKLYRVTKYENKRNNNSQDPLTRRNKKIIYSGKLGFPVDFARLSHSDIITSRFCHMSVLISLVAAVILGLLSGLIAGSPPVGLSSFALTLCVACPTGLSLASCFSLFTANKKLRKEGAVITNITAARKTASADAIVIESGDVFSSHDSEIFGMRNFNTVRADEALLYAAAIAIASGGPLKNAFETMVGDSNDLPPVNSLLYEDRQGLTAYINGQKTFLGNRALLEHHNIALPPLETEKKYINEDKNVLYLAIEKSAAIMFVVSYSPKKEMTDGIYMMTDNGINILVNTTDANITDDLFAYSFSIDNNSVQVLNASAGGMFKRRSKALKELDYAGVMHDGKTKSLIQSVCASISLTQFTRLATLIDLVFILLSLLAEFPVLTLTHASWINVLLFLILQTLSCVGFAVLSKIRKYF